MREKGVTAGLGVSKIENISNIRVTCVVCALNVHDRELRGGERKEETGEGVREIEIEGGRKEGR